MSKDEIRKAVMAQCTKGPDGVWYRMIIPQVTCRKCGSDRHDDGRRCPRCGGYQNPQIGMDYTSASIIVSEGSAADYLDTRKMLGRK